MKRVIASFGTALALVLGVGVADPAMASNTPSPSTVTVVGDFQSEAGCPGDWQPDCTSTQMVAGNGIWRLALSLPAGQYQYKAALNQTWDENYGANATANGSNIAFNLPVPATVVFYYDHETHWITDDISSSIATAAGDFQSEIGCPGDWDPSCLRSWLQDPDGDGTYTFTTAVLPPGDYALKVARDESWATSYPDTNVPFTVNTLGDVVTVTYQPMSGNAIDVSIQHLVQPSVITLDATPEPLAKGGSLALAGRVTAAGVGVPGARVVISFRPQGQSTFVRKSVLICDVDGGYSNSFTVYRTGAWRAKFTGSATVTPSGATDWVRVR